MSKAVGFGSELRGLAGQQQLSGHHQFSAQANQLGIRTGGQKGALRVKGPRESTALLGVKEGGIKLGPGHLALQHGISTRQLKLPRNHRFPPITPKQELQASEPQDLPGTDIRFSQEPRSKAMGSY